MPAESDDATTQSVPQWVFPPPGGFTADDFLRMRGLPRHTELIDGSLVFVSPQRLWHVAMIDLLRYELKEQAPKELRATREMSVKLAKRQVPEPDVLVVTAGAYERLQRQEPSTCFFAEEVVLAVEVISPESADRDREIKPRRYAAAGIQHFWLVEQEDEERAVVQVYERDTETGEYALTGTHHDRLKVAAPFGIDIDLTAVYEY